MLVFFDRQLLERRRHLATRSALLYVTLSASLYVTMSASLITLDGRQVPVPTVDLHVASLLTVTAVAVEVRRLCRCRSCRFRTAAVCLAPRSESWAASSSTLIHRRQSCRPTTILEVAKSLMKALGRSQDAYTINGAFRVGDIRHACADMEAARKLLDWKPKVSVEEGLTRLARWAQGQHRIKSSA